MAVIRDDCEGTEGRIIDASAFVRVEACVYTCTALLLLRLQSGGLAPSIRVVRSPSRLGSGASLPVFFGAPNHTPSVLQIDPYLSLRDPDTKQALYFQNVNNKNVFVYNNGPNIGVQVSSRTLLNKNINYFLIK